MILNLNGLDVELLFTNHAHIRSIQRNVDKSDILLSIISLGEILSLPSGTSFVIQNRRLNISIVGIINAVSLDIYIDVITVTNKTKKPYDGDTVFVIE